MWKTAAHPNFNPIGQGPDFLPLHYHQVSFGGFCPMKSSESKLSYAKTVSIFHLTAQFLSGLIPHMSYFRQRLAQMITAPSSSRCGSWTRRSPGTRSTWPTTANFGPEVRLVESYSSSEFQPDWPRSCLSTPSLPSGILWRLLSHKVR